MRNYSAEKKAAILKQLLPPFNKSCNDLSKNEGIPVSTIYTWAKNQNIVELMKKNKKNARGWSAEAQFSMLVETATLSEEGLGAYCREKGLYAEQIKDWKAQCVEKLRDKPNFKSPEKEQIKADKKRITHLEKELCRKEKALAEAAALLILRKKLQAFYGEGSEED